MSDEPVGQLGPVLTTGIRADKLQNGNKAMIMIVGDIYVDILISPLTRTTGGKYKESCCVILILLHV